MRVAVAGLAMDAFRRRAMSARAAPGIAHLDWERIHDAMELELRRAVRRHPACAGGMPPLCFVPD